MGKPSFHAPRGEWQHLFQPRFLPGNVKNKAWEVLLDCCFWWCFMLKENKQSIWPHEKLILHFRSKKTFSFALTGRILYQFSCWFWKAPERPAHQHPSTHAIQEMQTSQLTSGTHMICMHSLTFNTNDFVFLSETTFCF